MEQIARLVEAHRPDVLCLQETKVRDEEFPHAAFAALGYARRHVLGQPAYNGVAILSRLECAALPRKVWRRREDKRHIAVELALSARVSCELHCFYVPSGGGAPDRAVNAKLDDKFRFVEAMTRWSRALDNDSAPRLALGDFNIAYLDDDVWNHKTARRSVGHTPGECDAFARMLRAGSWVDLQRRDARGRAPGFTWWPYRFPGSFARDRGWRLDYALASPALADRVRSVETLRAPRGWESPSDHAPVAVTLDCR